jgi:hypothetical protein
MSANGIRVFAGRTAFATLAAILFLLTGCASVPLADPEQDAKLKSFTVKSDRAALYVYRNEILFGGMWGKFTVLLDGRLLGDTASMTYLYAELAPGKHRLKSQSGSNDFLLSFDTVAGKIYYVWQQRNSGQLQLVDENTGQAGVLQSKLVAPVK